MIGWARDFRLIPVVLVAIICLFALKSFGLIFNGGYMLHGLTPQRQGDADITGSVGTMTQAEPAGVNEPSSRIASQANAPTPRTGQSWAQQMFNYPDFTGSVPETKPAPKPPAPAPGSAPKGDRPASKGSEPVVDQPVPSPSRAERAILERLQERRLELDARARDLEMRESLLKAAEKRLESRILELKDVEVRAGTALAQKDEAEALRFKNLVTMYENMKAKDAAKIFDRLDMRVLMEVATQINPRRMSDILSQMTPESAERLTVELAARAKEKGRPAELPKIEGRPTN